MSASVMAGDEVQGAVTLLTVTVLVAASAQLGPSAFLTVAPFGLFSLWMCGHCSPPSLPAAARRPVPSIRHCPSDSRMARIVARSAFLSDPACTFTPAWWARNAWIQLGLYELKSKWAARWTPLRRETLPATAEDPGELSIDWMDDPATRALPQDAPVLIVLHVLGGGGPSSAHFMRGIAARYIAQPALLPQRLKANSSCPSEIRLEYCVSSSTPDVCLAWLRVGADTAGAAARSTAAGWRGCRSAARTSTCSATPPTLVDRSLLCRRTTPTGTTTLPALPSPQPIRGLAHWKFTYRM